MDWTDKNEGISRNQQIKGRNQSFIISNQMPKCLPSELWPWWLGDKNGI